MSAFRNIRDRTPPETTDQKSAPPSPPAGEAASGRTPPRIGKYEVEAEVGQGALVRVFGAFDRDTGRPVTLKAPTERADALLLKRFRREVADAANLRSAGMIAIYELGEHAGLPFAAMQRLGDEDLRSAIRGQKPLSLLQKVLVMWQVADGLQAAHRGGLVHVGIRPSAIALASDGSATIQDFGVVRLTPEEGDEAAAYSSPEELAGDAPDPLCDVFAFGTVFYELLTGTHPFLNADSLKTFLNRGSSAAGKDLPHGEPASLRDLVPECPDGLDRLVARALDRQRELRYQSLDDFRYDAEPVLRELKRRRAGSLLADARRLMDSSELEQTQGVLHEVLELDPENRKAQRLRQTLHETRRRRIVQSKLESLWREADEEAAARRFDRAVEILEAAAHLDPAHAETQKRLEQMKARLEQSRRLAQLLGYARQLLAEQALPQAHDVASEAAELDPQSAEAADLLRVIGEAIERRERLQGQLGKARSLLEQRQFGAAIELLESLRAEFPEDAQAPELLAQARAAAERAAVIAEAHTQSDRLRREEKFDDALAVLDVALARYAGDLSLTTLRREIEQQAQAFQAAAALRKTLEEAEWLLEQDRPDLAAQFLREKSAAFSDSPEFHSRLEATEAMLPGWEKQRFVQETLNRVAALEQRQQGSVALTVLEEALETCPTSWKLLEAASRLREQERRNKLARRIEAIGQKMAAQAWPQASALLEAAQAEFPDAPELRGVGEEIQAGQRRAQCDAIIAEVRQYLADGDTEQAEQALRKGFAALPDEPALEALRKELEAGKHYREDWRTAQVLFGKRRFQEAEQILARLAAPEHPEAQALLATVREARAASEEERLYNNGRETALKLIQEESFQEAADLLVNLLSVFPDDPILQRDLQTAENGARRQCPEPERRAEPPAEPVLPPPPPPAQPARPPQPVAPPVEPPRPVLTPVWPVRSTRPPEPAAPPVEPASVAPAPQPAINTMFQGMAPARNRRALVIEVAAALLLISAGAVVWKVSHSGSAAAHLPPAPVVRELPAVPPAHEPVVTPPPPVPAPENPPAHATGSRDRRKLPAKTPSRTFKAPAEATPPQGSPALPEPGAVAVGGDRNASVLAQLGRPISAPAPPGAGSSTLPAPRPRTGGDFREPKFIGGPAPVLPPLVRERRIAGEVNLEATIDKRGAVTRIIVRSGNPLLVPAARDAVLKRRYEPATLNGQPIEIQIPIKVVFDAGRR